MYHTWFKSYWTEELFFFIAHRHQKLITECSTTSRLEICTQIFVSFTGTKVKGQHYHYPISQIRNSIAAAYVDLITHNP